MDRHASLLVEEIARLVRAGGKRLRPMFCYCGFRAAGGRDGGPVVRAAAALELLHTMALVHDDLMDEESERRGVVSSAPHLAAEATARRFPVDPAVFGRSAAMLAGDLAAVLADRMLLTSGFEPDALVRALGPYHAMRTEMAAGQLLDVAGLGVDPEHAASVARLKGGAYTVEGPLIVGAALGGGSEALELAFRRFGGPLGEAFQHRDDLRDRDAAPGVTRERVDALVAEAIDALDDPAIPADTRSVLGALARKVGS